MAGNETLDPTEPQNNSSYSHEALLAIYDPLIRLDDAGVPGPGLAESWTRNEDLTELTLKLRHGVTFHDGTPFNSEAVKRNFERSASLGRRAGNTVSETFGLVSAMEFRRRRRREAEAQGAERANRILAWHHARHDDQPCADQGRWIRRQPNCGRGRTDKLNRSRRT